LDFLKNELSFKWKDEHRAIKDFKEKLSSTLVLKFLNFTKFSKVHTNASDFVIEGVFMQKEHFEKLCGTQLQWPTHERNCMLLYVT
jgi:hypothetical protein